MPFKQVDNFILPLLKVPLTVSGSWQDLGNFDQGPFINLKDCLSVALWVKVDINLSTGIKFQMLGADSPTGDLYNLPIKEVTATEVKLTPNIIKLANNVDQSIVFSFSVTDQLPLGKIQVMATVVGGTPGQILAAGITFTSRNV